MGRLTTLIGLLAMSVAVLALTWPLVEKESLPYLLMLLEWAKEAFMYALSWLSRLVS